MAKLNTDEKYEPIEITIEGREFKIEKITKETMDKVAAIEKNNDSVFYQFAIITGSNVEEIKKFDFRKVGSALEFINQQIMESLPKNALKAEVSQ